VVLFTLMEPALPLSILFSCVVRRVQDADVDQGFARSLDRDIRKNPLKALRGRPDRIEKIMALIDVACQFLTQGAPGVGPNQIHRLDKADTKLGADDVRARAAIGVPYAMLLYERFLGRPFAGASRLSIWSDWRRPGDCH